MKASITQAATFIAAFVAHANAYNCWKNTDNAGRWADSLSPADRLVDLCKRGGSGERCYQAAKGRMCVKGPGNDAFCNYAWGWAGSQQSWHDDWFLWADLTCDGGVDGGDDDIYVRIL